MQPPPCPGPATNLACVGDLIEHEPRKSRIRALATFSDNYVYLLGMWNYSL